MILGRFGAEGFMDHAPDRRSRQRRQPKAVDGRERQPLHARPVPVRGGSREENREHAGDVPRRLRDQHPGAGIHPVNVVEDEDSPPFGGAVAKKGG